MKQRIHFRPTPDSPLRSCSEIPGFTESMVVRIKGVKFEHPGAARERTASVAEVTCPVCLALLRVSGGREIEAVLEMIGAERILFFVRGKIAIPILPSRNLLDQAVEVFCCGGLHSVVQHQDDLRLEAVASAYGALAAMLWKGHHSDRDMKTAAEAMLDVGAA